MQAPSAGCRHRAGVGLSIDRADSGRSIAAIIFGATWSRTELIGGNFGGGDEGTSRYQLFSPATDVFGQISPVD